jgi:hypothetical protein
MIREIIASDKPHEVGTVVVTNLWDSQMNRRNDVHIYIVREATKEEYQAQYAPGERKIPWYPDTHKYYKISID